MKIKVLVGHTITVNNFEDQGLPQELKDIQDKQGYLTVAAISEGNNLQTVIVEEMPNFMIYDFTVNSKMSNILRTQDEIVEYPHTKISPRQVRTFKI